MADDEETRLRGLLEGSATAGYLLARRTPPSPADAAASSYVGAAPRLPPDVGWPADSGGRALPFIAQIDLGALPPLPGGSPLPAHGTLFFFANTGDEGLDRRETAAWAAVRHGTGIGPQPMHPLPPTLPPILDGQGPYTLRWLREGDPAGSDEPRTYPFWPITAHAIRSYPTGHAEMERYSDAGNRYATLCDAAQAAAFATVFGPPATYAPPPWWRAGDPRFDPAPFTAPDHGAVWVPHPAWPFAWVHVRIVTAALLRAVEDADRALRLALDRQRVTGEEATAARATHAAARQGAEAWYARARRDGLADAVPAEDRAAFLAWLRGVAQPAGPDDDERDKSLRVLAAIRINGWTADSLEQGTDACLGYGASPAALPPEVLRVLAPAYAPFHQDIFDTPRLTRHQLLGAPRAIQGAAESLAPTHRLLAQFDHDPRMMFFFGDVGAVQFWITPDDLGAGRFENVVATCDSH